MQAAKRRFVIAQKPENWFAAFVAQDGVFLAPLPPSVLIASSFLPGAPPKDPADRIIAATAREYGFAVLTRDRRLLDYADAGHINAVPC
jgi:PIN domain nuclease of toxin-antitoxin system